MRFEGRDNGEKLVKQMGTVPGFLLVARLGSDHVSLARFRLTTWNSVKKNTSVYKWKESNGMLSGINFSKR